VTAFVPTVALIGIVIIVASLASGIIERVGFPLVGAFLLLGAALGPSGFGLVDIQLNSPQLQVLATLGLTLVLFSDAVSMDTREVRERVRLAIVVLGPGTLIPALLVAVAAYYLLDLSIAAAAIVGAAISSTDPVLLRTVLRSPELPPTARVALRLESGMNDVALLPVVVLATVAMGTAAHGGLSLGRHLVGLFLLGPALGALVGWVGITMLTNIRDRIGVRRDYESLYALGIGFAAYAAAEAVGGSGFLAAFAAGFAIATLDVELCDCFLEYGEATAEMLLLLTFVALGTSLIWTGFGILDVATIAFAVIALSMRTLVLYPVLAQMGVEKRERKLISLFGPRGLSSLLLVLIPVFAGVPGSDRLFTITSLVVLLSLAIHGGIIGYYLRRRRRPATPARAPRAALPTLESPVDERITIAEVEAMRARGDEVVLVDARAAKSFNADPRQAAGAVRLPPDDPVRAAQEVRLSQRGTVVVYCA
jgi:NhaP-type Na+/H+ or K+/H+ antiporter